LQDLRMHRAGVLCSGSHIMPFGKGLATGLKQRIGRELRLAWLGTEMKILAAERVGPGIGFQRYGHAADQVDGVVATSPCDVIGFPSCSSFRTAFSSASGQATGNHRQTRHRGMRRPSRTVRLIRPWIERVPGISHHHRPIGPNLRA
jgi:hypothetical protein